MQTDDDAYLVVEWMMARWVLVDRHGSFVWWIRSLLGDPTTCCLYALAGALLWGAMVLG